MSFDNKQIYIYILTLYYLNSFFVVFRDIAYNIPTHSREGHKKFFFYDPFLNLNRYFC